MAIILHCEQRSDEWYKARRGVLTASACESFMTSGMRKTFVNKMLAEIITGESEPFELNQYMQWGIDTEDKARNTYEARSGNKVEQVGFVYKDEDKRIGCSPDGLIGEDGLIEIKCPMSKTHLGYLLENEPPKKYFLQMQFQMYITGRKWCDFVSFDPRLPDSLSYMCVRVDRCPDTIYKIKSSANDTITQIEEFLNNHNLTWEKPNV